MNLRDFFQITRPLVVPDCETTGTNPQKDRICEIGFQVHYPDERPILEWRTLVNPEIEISLELEEIHGVRNKAFTLCAKCGQLPGEHPSLECNEFRPWPKFHQIANNLARGFTDVDFAGKNVRFDLRFIAAEMERAKVKWNYIGARIIDAERLEQLGEPRTLSHLYKKHTGREPQDAHQALADVRMTTAVLEAQLLKYHMPRSLDELHEMQWPGWIDPDGKFCFKNGEACFANWGKHAGRRMREVGADYWDFILRGEFSAEVRAIAQDAKLGRFPEKQK